MPAIKYKVTLSDDEIQNLVSVNLNAPTEAFKNKAD